MNELKITMRQTSGNILVNSISNKLQFTSVMIIITPKWRIVEEILAKAKEKRKKDMRIVKEIGKFAPSSSTIGMLNKVDTKPQHYRTKAPNY